MKFHENIIKNSFNLRRIPKGWRKQKQGRRKLGNLNGLLQRELPIVKLPPFPINRLLNNITKSI